MPEEANAWNVTYIDFGNYGVVEAANMRPIDDAAAAAERPLARECALAYVRAAPIDQDLGIAAAEQLHAETMGQEFVAKIHGMTDAGRTKRLVVSLFAEGEAESVAERLLQRGLLRISKRDALRVRRRAAEQREGSALDLAHLESLEAAQAEARSERLGFWMHGDAYDSGDD
jgi:endonuclease YncB( thermonuclease family)